MKIDTVTIVFAIPDFRGVEFAILFYERPEI